MVVGVELDAAALPADPERVEVRDPDRRNGYLPSWYTPNPIAPSSRFLRVCQQSERFSEPRRRRRTAIARRLLRTTVRGLGMAGNGRRCDLFARRRGGSATRSAARTRCALRVDLRHRQHHDLRPQRLQQDVQKRAAVGLEGRPPRARSAIMRARPVCKSYFDDDDREVRFTVPYEAAGLFDVDESGEQGGMATPCGVR